MSMIGDMTQCVSIGYGKAGDVLDREEARKLDLHQIICPIRHDVEVGTHGKTPLPITSECPTGSSLQG